ncbi:uncharacterized protein [Hemitrygon akajei]|uniref:uncharacterized protein n=1 Tax=Hemitrygon akajei TaxID=2704970 RepID=UPI003BF9CAFE
MDTDLNSAISAFLSNCEDQQLLQLTRFYMERLVQSVEQGVEGVGFMLTYDHHFNEREYHRVTELAEKGNRADASKLLLDLVMEKGSGARRVMWESFVKLHQHLPKLSRILKEIRERGDGQFAYMDRERDLSEVPAHLKDLNSAISAFLSNCDDHKLFRLTRFYMDRLEFAIEEGVDGVGFMLMGDDHFTGQEYHRVAELAEKGNRADASKLLLDLVMEKGSEARRVMWESFVKLHQHLPKLSRILKEIWERGDGQFAYMDRERGLSEVPAHLKDLNSAISAFLSNCEDHQLFRLSRFYMERLEQAIEEGVEGIGFMLMAEDHFTGPEYHVSVRNIA